MDDKQIADYFIISGLSEYQELNHESKPLINPVLPITDITVIIRGHDETCPEGYVCIEKTPGGHPADLNNGNFNSPNIQICYRRGNDKPPLVDVGVYHEGKERVLPDVEVVYTTPYGRCASSGFSTSSKGTYITFRRAKTLSPYNQMVVVDLCVILNNKSEYPPHAFYSIKKNLNKSYYGMIGSEVFLCYKKTILSPPSLCYKPQIISRFPLQDYANFPLPDTVPLFCLPTGANIEVLPLDAPPPKPVHSTFVLTSDSAQKIYGSALSFYEWFDPSRLTADQRGRLGMLFDKFEHLYDTYALKSICILSRWPFFQCFQKFLLFLHVLVFDSRALGGESARNHVTIEHYISHFLLNVTFPSAQRPTVLVQLMPGTDETLTISQPSSRLPLPLTGASFTQLLMTLGVENTMNVLLYGLSEQKILLHSLNPWVLTGVAEAISAMLFPFHWQCPYVPLCPLSLHGILNAPLPFIVGIDSRCFDNFSPPDDVICIDLDTRSIFLSELKRCLNSRILPKRAARVLRNSLDKIFQKIMRIMPAVGATDRSPEKEVHKQQQEKKFELEIQEAFVRFMATVLRGFRSYLLPITRAPTAEATDPTSLFDFEGFLMSRDRNHGHFYQLITKTQMFTHYIEERSFVSDKDTSLAFFDDCEEKLVSSDDMFSDRPIKLFDKDDGLIQTDCSVYIPAPEQSPSPNCAKSNQEPEARPDRVSSMRNKKFGPLDASLFHRHPQVNKFPSLDKALKCSRATDDQFLFDNGAATRDFTSSFSMSRRTKQEVKTSQKMAKKSCENHLEWSKYLVSCCYCLWFSTLPSYVTYFSANNQQDPSQVSCNEKRISNMLRYAHNTIVHMRMIQLSMDEICFRVLTLLCGRRGQPALAVRVFLEMRKAGIKPNAVTYGYYNKAVLESEWKDCSRKKSASEHWRWLKNIFGGVALFKTHGRLRRERRNGRLVQLITDPNFPDPNVNLVNIRTGQDEYFHPTTVPLSGVKDSGNLISGTDGRHRRSLVNRSFTVHNPASSSLDLFSLEKDAALEPRNSAQSTDNSNQSLIHKSFSMHLRNDSPEHGTLIKTKSSSLEDDDEEIPVAKTFARPLECHAPSKDKPHLELYDNLRMKYQLLVSQKEDWALNDCLEIMDTSAGLLFSTSPESVRSVSRVRALSSGQFDQSKVNGCPIKVPGSNNFLHDSSLSCDHHKNLIQNASDFLSKESNFGEDAQILRKIETCELGDRAKHELDPAILNNSLAGDELDSTPQAQATGSKAIDAASRSDSIAATSLNETQDDEDSDEDYGLLRSVTSTPNNFKLSSLINDASNLQWSKWTSSQNSKKVYKNIKSAATGIVSSLQEIKSSLSNANTPAKLLSSQYRSTTTREMLSQWANYFSYQPARSGAYGESDDSSLASDDLLGLSNEEDIEPSSAEVGDSRDCHRLFEALERHYKGFSSSEDLLGQVPDSPVSGDERVAVVVNMTTCSRCNVCKSLLYDEEIMERWSSNESNLNSSCVYCRAKMVPLMSITIEDYRFKSCSRKRANEELIDIDGDKLSNVSQSSKRNGPAANLLIDIDTDSADDNKETNSTLEPAVRHSDQRSFTVPYLSPIVLRKELESVFESSGDNCPASSRFVDEHPIIYWNLLWYFDRINVPTHLPLLCISSKFLLDDREVPMEWQNSRKIIVRTLWDNEKLHSDIGKPLYRLWERGDPSLQVESILCDKLQFSSSFLEQVMNLIRSNDLQKAMNLVLNARLKSCNKFSFDKNRHNLYRDLIFLTIVALGPSKFCLDNFEREYKKSFESLNFQQVALNRFDRPPTTRSLFCRKCFKELSLKIRT